MTRLLRLASLLVILVLVSAWPIFIDAQTKSPAKDPASLVASLEIQRERVPIDLKPLVILTVKNISSNAIPLRSDMPDYRIHVDGENGEAPKTFYHRRLRGELQPGESELALGGPILDIPLGESNVHKYDLASEEYCHVRMRGRTPPSLIADVDQESFSARRVWEVGLTKYLGSKRN